MMDPAHWPIQTTLMRMAMSQWKRFSQIPTHMYSRMASSCGTIKRSASERILNRDDLQIPRLALHRQKSIRDAAAIRGGTELSGVAPQAQDLVVFSHRQLSSIGTGF